MSGEHKDGLPAAIDALVGADPGRVAEEPEQFEFEDLLGLPRPENGLSEASRAGVEVTALLGTRRAGRPPGARNRKTREWVDYLLARYPSPLEGLLQLASTPVAVLAQALGCTPLEALQAQTRAREAALPYLHQKLPQELTVRDPDRIPLDDAPWLAARDVTPPDGGSNEGVAARHGHTDEDTGGESDGGANA